MKKKKKRRLKIDRVLLVLFVIIVFVFIIKFISYTIYNEKIYSKVKNTNKDIVEINAKYEKLKLYNKTINLIKEKKLIIKLKNKKYNITIPFNNISENMNINVNLYNKIVNEEGFSSTQSYFIDSKLLTKASNIKIKIPKYLTKNSVVDIYGLTERNNIELVKSCYKIKSDEVSIKLDNKYSKYFITYVKLEDMKVKDMTVKKDSIINLIIEYVPKNATIKEYEYTKLGDIFVKNENNEIIAKNLGKGTITIRHKIQNVEKKINIEVKEEKIKVKDGLTYVDGILIVNKTYSLPKDYNPGKLNEEALNAFYEMREAASKDGIVLYISSGYRSYSTQQNLYNVYVVQDGKEKADTYSARAGHSEHQTGLAMDLNIIDSSFEGTPESIWLSNNSYKYGFIIRYPKDKESITGYTYEPWHIRYLGKDTAKKVYDSGLTLEEYLDIDSKYSE